METSEEIKNIINNGFDLISTEAAKCGVKFEQVEDDRDGVLDDDGEIISFATSIRCPSFDTDDGRVIPAPVMFEMTFDRFNAVFNITLGEDEESAITYGNVMAYMYFSALTTAE